MLTIIICTHNPRLDYLRETLLGLRNQSLELSEWELLLVDNRSDESLAAKVDLQWHPNARLISEDELGLTPARVRGIREAVGEWLVFVDDDNILDPSYLVEVLRVIEGYPLLGVFGAGKILPKYEVPLPIHLEFAKPWLALRDNATDVCSNDPTLNGSCPCGAGMVIRRDVAENWADQLSGARMSLDRKGTSLASAGDTDMVWDAVSQGYGTGTFVNLQIEHLISAERVSRSYLLKLADGLAYSLWTLGAIRIGFQPRMNRPASFAYLAFMLLKNLKNWRFTLTSWRAVRRARRDYNALPRVAERL